MPVVLLAVGSVLKDIMSNLKDIGIPRIMQKSAFFGTATTP